MPAVLLERGQQSSRRRADSVRNRSTVTVPLALKGSPAILAGRIFDDRGNRMTPTHTNKRGVRYRYYVSHALMQKRAHEAGSVSRVPAPEIESLVDRCAS